MIRSAAPARCPGAAVRPKFLFASAADVGESCAGFGLGNAAGKGIGMKQAFGIAVPQTLEDVCDRGKLALLVYDMQVGIVSQLKGAEAVTMQVARVVEASRNAGLRIFFTRHMSLPKELMGAFQYRMAMAWQRVDDPAQVAGFMASRPHLHYVDGQYRGYFILDMTKQRMQADFYGVATVAERSTKERFEAGFITESGQNHLIKASTPA
jgi:hypothetical protein